MIRSRWAAMAAAVLAWTIGLIAWIGGDPGVSATAYDAFSTYNTSPGGLSQAFAYLSARPGVASVRRLVRDVARERPPRGATIFRIGAAGPTLSMDIEDLEPGRPEQRKKPGKSAERRGQRAERSPALKKKEEPAVPLKSVENLLADDEDAWVRAGGRLVLAMSGERAQIRPEAGACSAYRQVFPIDPPLPRIDVPNCHTLGGGGLQRFHSLLINDAGPVLARWRLGAGEVLLFSIPEAFSNEYLDRGGNLALLERFAGAGRVVYFDENVHGFTQEGSVWNLLIDDWRLGPSLVILAAAALAAFWRRARTTGPPERPERDIRSDAVDLVQSLGRLYDRAIDREESLRLYYQGLVRAVHARTGLSGQALERLVRTRTDGYDPRPRFKDISREEFQLMLQILNRAYETVGYANTR